MPAKKHKGKLSTEFEPNLSCWNFKSLKLSKSQGLKTCLYVYDKRQTQALYRLLLIVGVCHPGYKSGIGGAIIRINIA